MSSSARTSLENPASESEATGPTTSSPHSLSKAVHARRAEYTRPQKIKVKIGSWNVAACPGTEKDLRGWFVEGKGVDKKLSGLNVAEDGSQDHIESVSAQEERRTKKESTIPKGDEGTIVGGEEVGLYVLGLQEVVDLNSAREYIGRVYTDPEPTAKWRKALVEALPKGYVQVMEQQLSGILLFIFASPEVAPTISSVSTVSVGTGIMGYLGNKGAVATRIILGETTRMVFINSHLASGSDPTHLERRCWDVTQILQRTQFDPISWTGVLDDNYEGIGEEDFAFWFGDLNFRLDGLPGDDIRRLLMLHTKGEYTAGERSRDKIDTELDGADGPIVIHSVESDSDSDDEDSEPRTSSNFGKDDDASSQTLPDPDDFVQDPSQDPASLQATLDSLLPHDQLRNAIKKKKVFHDGWREGPITFLPTYKYDVGSMGMFDSSEKKRSPSWCDRILFRTRKDKLEHDTKVREEEQAKKKDEEMKARGIDHANDDEDVLFNYNPDEDGAEDAPNNDYDEYNEEEETSPETIITKAGFTDRIQQDIYISHQRVLSSDHKPLDAVFTLEYDAVVAELKAKIQAEVARDLDRAENEGRPGITIVADHSQDEGGDGGDAVDFGNVAYLQRKARSLTIANTSQVEATFTFVERPSASGAEEERIAPLWLSVSFVRPEMDEVNGKWQDLKKDITLSPGDTINATLELFIDDLALVRSLNEHTAQLDDILILRVTGGRDHFIPVRGAWLQSSFARSVDELIRIPEGGVRALVPARSDPNGKPINRGQEVCWSAPRELFKLTEAIETLTERVLADAEILESAQLPKESAGWPFDPNSWLLRDANPRGIRKRYVLEALDSDKNLNESFPPEIPAIEKVEILAEVLVSFLGSITDGIVSLALWQKLEDDMNSRIKPLTDTEELKAWVLDILSASPNHNISFVFLTSMLNRVAGELAPVPKASWRNSLGSTKIKGGLESVRRSLSWKGRGAPVALTQAEDPGVKWRERVERAFAEVFAGCVFKGPEGVMKEKERRVVQERRRDILEAFVRGRRD